TPLVQPYDAHNQLLVSNVHPPDWANPEPAGRYNLVVVGAGTAGLISAAGAAGLGARVALVEREFLGGDCLNVGCVPSKALIRASRAAAEVRGAHDYGVEVPAGARPVGCELAQAFARFGARVSLLGNRPRIMPREDPDAAHIVEEQMRRDGVNLVLGCNVVRVAREGAEKVLHLECGGRPAEVRADAILVGVGRAPNVQGLGLEAAGVAYDEKEGVRVNDRLQTTNRRVFAAGDICSRFQFTHAADAMARVVIQNALFFGRAKASALVISCCNYYDPEVAHVGPYVAETDGRGLDV